MGWPRRTYAHEPGATAVTDWWVSHSRPVGCPQMTWGMMLENALKSKGISKDFDEWDTRVTPEEKRRFLAQRAQETEQRRALFNAETDAETT